MTPSARIAPACRHSGHRWISFLPPEEPWIPRCGWDHGQSTHKRAAGCRGKASSTEHGDIHPLAQRVLVLVRRYVGKPATEGGTGEAGSAADDQGDPKHQKVMHAEYGYSRSGAGQRGENRSVPPMAETQVEDGSAKYKKEARRASDRSDGSNLRLGHVRRRHELGQ
jgi:hypothetical protein